METTPIVLSPNTQVGNFRATDDSATASYRQYADAAASAGLNTMQFNNVSQPADWASVPLGSTVMHRGDGSANQQASVINTLTLEIVPAPVSSSGNSLLPQRPDEQIIKRLPRIPGGYACHHPGCSSRWDTKKALNKHVRTHILGVNRKHKCLRCGKGFNDRRDLNRHLGGKNPCRPRNYMARPQGLAESIATSLNEPTTTNAQPSYQITQDQEDTPDSSQSSSSSSSANATHATFRCYTCGEDFPDKVTLLDHNRHSSAHNRITIDET